MKTDAIQKNKSVLLHIAKMYGIWYYIHDLSVKYVYLFDKLGFSE